MSSPYREAAHLKALTCPRCNESLPPVDVAACGKGCGTWVTAVLSTMVFRAGETNVNRLTRWWRVRAPCPVCAERMTLRGLEPALFQGCEIHGYWVDADVVRHTGLGQPDISMRMQRDSEAFEAERARIEKLEVEQARQREIDAISDAQAREAARRAHAREEYVALVEAAVHRGSVEGLADLLLTLYEQNRALAKRIDDLERELDEE